MNGVTDGYIRVTVTRGITLGLDPKNINGEPTVVISTDKLSLYPKSMYENGLVVVTVGDASRQSAGDGASDQIDGQVSVQHPGQDRGQPGRARAKA